MCEICLPPAFYLKKVGSVSAAVHPLLTRIQDSGKLGVYSSTPKCECSYSIVDTLDWQYRKIYNRFSEAQGTH